MPTGLEISWFLIPRFPPSWDFGRDVTLSLHQELIHGKTQLFSVYSDQFPQFFYDECSRKGKEFEPRATRFRQGKKSLRLGFMVGEGQVPDDFNSMGQDQIETLFYGTE